MNMKSSVISAGKPPIKARSSYEQSNGDDAASAQSQPTHEQIANLAHQLYIESGCQEGRDTDNWLQAEQMLRQRPGRQGMPPRVESAHRLENHGAPVSPRQF